MNYEMREAKTEADAIGIIKDALAVLDGQIKFERGERKRSWNGQFVDHVTEEAKRALAFLTIRFPPGSTH